MRLHHKILPLGSDRDIEHVFIAVFKAHVKEEGPQAPNTSQLEDGMSDFGDMFNLFVLLSQKTPCFIHCTTDKAHDSVIVSVSVSKVEFSSHPSLGVRDDTLSSTVGPIVVVIGYADISQQAHMLVPKVPIFMYIYPTLYPIVPSVLPGNTTVSLAAAPMNYVPLILLEGYSIFDVF